MYRIRLDIVNNLTSDALIHACETLSHVIVRHELPHGNPHFHAYVQSDLKENTLRQRIKRLDPNLKSTDYSIKKCTPDRINEYVQYMFNTKHGNKFELIDCHNYDNDTLNTCIENARQVSESFEESHKKKCNKPTIYDLAMEIRQRYKQKYHIEDNPLENLGHWESAPSGAQEYYEHLSIAISVCRKYNQPFEEHYLRRIVTTAICEGSTGRQTIISKIMQKEFPNH